MAGAPLATPNKVKGDASTVEGVSAQLLDEVKLLRARMEEILLHLEAITNDKFTDESRG